jgi:tRNA U38,U39,U40 pseudouridine synthase TruA
MTTIQGVLENVLLKMKFRRHQFQSSTRTDKGVNAQWHPCCIEAENHAFVINLYITKE